MAITESSAVIRLINSVQGQPILDSFHEPEEPLAFAPESPPLQADFPTFVVKAPKRGRWPLYDTVTTSELDFRYRSSKLKETGEVVITGWLRGHEAEPAEVEKEMRRQLELRKNQPGGPSTGSVFKNPEGDHAGRLIEECGLKGHRIGGVEVSSTASRRHSSTWFRGRRTLTRLP